MKYFYLVLGCNQEQLPAFHEVEQTSFLQPKQEQIRLLQHLVWLFCLIVGVDDWILVSWQLLIHVPRLSEPAKQYWITYS